MSRRGKPHPTEAPRTGAERDHPDSPNVAVGCVVLHDDRVLLVRRGRAPSRGLWAVPGGAVELGERLAEAAKREVREETGVEVAPGEIVHVFEAVEHDERGRVRFHYVIIDLAARFLAGDPRPGGDATAAGWFNACELGSLDLSAETRRLLAERFGFGDPAEVEDGDG